MKYLIFSILLLTTSSCYKKECGSNMPLNIVLQGYSEQEGRMSILYKFTKGTNFGSLVDSNTHLIASGIGRISNIDFDYKIKINTQEIFISNLNIEQVSKRKFGLAKTKELMICPLEDDYIVQGTNVNHHGDSVFISK